MEIVVNNKASRPLYEQIVSQIKTQIMSGELNAGKGCYVSVQNQDFYLEEQQKRWRAVEAPIEEIFVFIQ